jgi:hypothetical protein
MSRIAQRSQPLAPETRVRLQLLISEVGDSAPVAALVGLDERTVLRGVCGLGLYRGKHEQIRAALPEAERRAGEYCSARLAAEARGERAPALELA